MTPEDRQKLKDEFNEIAKTSPYANEVINGWFTNEGEPMTRGKLLELSTMSEEFYTEVDKMLSKGTTTLDQFIDGIRKNMNVSKPDPK